MFGGNGDDVLRARNGDTRMSGGDGDDRLVGAGGDDSLTGGAGRNRMEGGGGDDEYYVSDTRDVVVEEAGAGFDRVITTVDTVLSDNVEDIIIQGTSHSNATGNDLDNRISGSTGRNILRGERGADTLYGNAGDDVLVGGRGADSLNGGTGDTRFVYERPADSNAAGGRDTVFDFNLFGTDMIDLEAIDAVRGTAGNQAFTFIDDDAFTNTAGELRYDGGIVMADSNGDGTADLEIIIDGLPTLTAGDFLL